MTTTPQALTVHKTTITSVEQLLITAGNPVQHVTFASPLEVAGDTTITEASTARDEQIGTAILDPQFQGCPVLVALDPERRVVGVYAPDTDAVAGRVPKEWIAKFEPGAR